MHSPLVSWSRTVLIASVVLVIALIIPTVWFPLQVGKLAVFATLLLIAALFFAIGRGGVDAGRAHGLKLALLALLLPVSYAVSMFFSIDPSISLTGYGIEVDTVLFTALLGIAFLFSFVYFRTLRTLSLLTKSIYWALVVAVVFQWLVVIFGTNIIPFSIFSDRTVNLIGKWNDFGLLAALLATWILVRLELSPSSRLWQILRAVGLALTVVLLGIVNFSLAWWFMLPAAIVIGLVAFMTERSARSLERQSNPYASASWAQMLPWYSIAVVVVSVVFLLFGSQINTMLTDMFSAQGAAIQSLEVRPSYSSTFGVIDAARAGSAEKIFFGTGPNTFTSSWLAHKPAEVNQSQFWNLDFSVGFSTLLTALGTVGLVGALMWLIPALLVLAGIVRVIRLSLLSREERAVATTVAIGAIFLFAAIALYVPSGNLVILAFVLSGAAFGFLWRQGRHAGDEESVSPSSALLGWGVVVVLVLVSLWGTLASDRRFVALAQANNGAAALSAGNADEALSDAAGAQRTEQTSDTLRLGVEAGILKIQQLAQDPNASTAAVQNQFTAVASSTIATAQTLIKAYPNDYRSYLSLARIYDLLSSLKISGAYQGAEAQYQAALERDPSAPDIALALAQLEASQNNTQLTEQYLSQALTLKPNYTDAILLVVQLSVAANDLPTAVRAAQAASQTAPGVAPIWFELGLLYYAGGDTKDAISPLETALSIQSDYANAKYFLGLSYYAQSRQQDAIKQFQDLATSNPDSSEVKLILTNMQAGKDPFASSTPPVTNPALSPSAPINE